MTKAEAIAKIEELKEYIKNIDENEEVIFLLSVNEYKKYKNKIPKIFIWWWLRSPGDNSELVADVGSAGSVNEYGYNVYYESGAVRPALRYRDLKSEIVMSKHNPQRFIYNDFPFIIIDEKEEIAIAEVPIAWKRFNERVDKGNKYCDSDIRKFLLEWIKKDESVSNWNIHSVRCFD